MEFKGVAFDDDRMAGVVSSVESNYVIRIAGKEISDFTFAFIAPLSADNDGDFRRIGRHAVPRGNLVEWRLTSR